MRYHNERSQRSLAFFATAREQVAGNSTAGQQEGETAMAMPQITVVGSSNTDLVTRVAHLPAPGETILGSDVAYVAGGKGANQAVAARRIGAEVTFVGCLGDDGFGEAAAAHLAREGLWLDYLARIPSPSGLALIAVATDGANSIIVAPGANARLAPAHIDRAAEAIQRSQVVIAQCETPLPATQRAFTLARAAAARTLLNPAPARPLPDDLMALVDILVCNETEAAALTGVPVAAIAEVEAAARALHARGLTLVIVTLGARGCLVAEGDSLTHLPAFAVPVVDTTAAGDAFVGAMAVRLAHGDDPTEAARYASAAAALSVGVMGAQPALPTGDAVAKFLATY
jgi:ribokinase